MKTTNEFLKSLNIEVSNLSSVSGTKKENIYKKDIFADCLTDREKKTKRRNLRNLLDNWISAILRTTDKTKLQKLCTDFDKYYKAVYNINDYSLLSICSNNTEDIKKTNIQKMLDIVKANIKTKEVKKTISKKEVKKEENVKEEVNK